MDSNHGTQWEQIYSLPRLASSLTSQMVGATRFEHATSWSQTKRSTKLNYAPIRKQDRLCLVFPGKLSIYTLLTCLLYMKNNYKLYWWERRDLNPHEVNPHRILSPVCLPIPPRSQMVPASGLEPETY